MYISTTITASILTAGGPHAADRGGCESHGKLLVGHEKFYTDTWSHVDLPTTSEQLRGEVADGKVLMELEKTDILELTKAGWHAPEVFVAKGRDGQTDIWGVDHSPDEFRPKKEISGRREHLRRAARIVRSKEFLGVQRDAGTGRARLHRRPDRRNGHVEPLKGIPRRRRGKTSATPASPTAFSGTKPPRQSILVRHRPRRRLRRSAGGQNSLGALLFHPEFYKAAVPTAAATTTAWIRSGGTSNGWAGRSARNTPRRRMSTTPSVYKATSCWSSAKWTRTSNPPRRCRSSDALIKANKIFDLLVVPGEDHGAGRGGPSAAYGDRKRFDFFVQHLLGQSPPDWNAPAR